MFGEFTTRKHTHTFIWGSIVAVIWNRRPRLPTDCHKSFILLHKGANQRPNGAVGVGRDANCVEQGVYTEKNELMPDKIL